MQMSSLRVCRVVQEIHNSEDIKCLTILHCNLAARLLHWSVMYTATSIVRLTPTGDNPYNVAGKAIDKYANI